MKSRIKLSVKQETFKEFNRLKNGERFQSDEFAVRMKRKTGESHHVDTYLRYLREYRRMTGRQIVNVNKAKSIYEVVG